MLELFLGKKEKDPSFEVFTCPYLVECDLDCVDGLAFFEGRKVFVGPSQDRFALNHGEWDRLLHVL